MIQKSKSPPRARRLREGTSFDRKSFFHIQEKPDQRIAVCHIQKIHMEKGRFHPLQEQTENRKKNQTINKIVNYSKY